MSPDAEADPDCDECIAMVLTEGVIHGQYAAMRHGISTALRGTIDVIVPHGTNLVVPSANIQVHRTRRPQALTVGVETRETELGIPVRMTSPARTIVDLIRRKHVDSDDYRHGLAALSDHLQEPGRATEIRTMAVEFEKWLGPELDIAIDLAIENEQRRYGA